MTNEADLDLDEYSHLDDDSNEVLKCCDEMMESLRSAEKIVLKVFAERSHILYTAKQAISSPELNEIKVELFTALELCKRIKRLSFLPF
jgi:hypothetical protein